MKKIGDKYTNNIFENIKHIDEHESEYWYARELSKVLEYRDWRNFLKVLNKAKDACKNSGFNIDKQLVEVNRLSKRNNNAIANIQDYKLSRRKGAFKKKGSFQKQNLFKRCWGGLDFIMKLIDDTEFLVIDFETITPKGRPPEPIEVGILRIKQKKIDNNASIDWLIKPPEGLHLTRFDTSQTGITEQDLMHGIDAKRAMRIIDKSCSKKDYVFIAQNAKYEANILSHYTDECKGIAKTPIIDTILLAKHVLPKLSNYKLDTLASTLGLRIPENRHRALSDCFLTAEVFLKLLELQKGKHEIIYLDELLNIAKIKTKYSEPQQLTLGDFMGL